MNLGTILLSLSLALSQISNETLEEERLNANVDGMQLQEQLSTDYDSLLEFSELREMSNTNFNALFWEGLEESIDFYLSPKRMRASVLSRSIDKRLLPHADFGYKLVRPEIINPNFSFAVNSLNSFAGNWTGYWEDMCVNHFWLSVRTSDFHFVKGCTLVGFQSCYVGDGIGWNYLVRRANHMIILGFVCHMNREGKVLAQNPHYGYLTKNKQIIWVTNDHLYFEFISNSDTYHNPRQYVIAGSKYECTNKKPVLGVGFQTVYQSGTSIKWSQFKYLILPDYKDIRSSYFRLIMKTFKNGLNQFIGLMDR